MATIAVLGTLDSKGAEHAFVAERIREALLYFVLITASAMLQVFAISLALRHPPIALAVAALLLVGMMLHAVLTYSPDAYAK